MDRRVEVLVRQLQGALAGNRLGEQRVSGATCPTGLTVISTDTTGIAVPVGCAVIYVSPATHWNFTWFPRSTDIVVQNAGASQNIDFRYVVVG